MTKPVDVLAILEHEADGWDCDTPEYNKIMQAHAQVAALLAENAELRQRMGFVVGELLVASITDVGSPLMKMLLRQWAERLTEEKAE